MPEIENEPITWKSFRSLPQLAVMTWVVVFTVDAIFIAPKDGMQDFDKLKAIWAIGYSVAFLFEILRIYRKRGIDKKKDNGDFAFIPLNALLIFFYASACNGFTKQVGSWSTARNVLDKEKVFKIPEKESSIFAAIEWAVPILAMQTSYWPDVKVIAEKHALQEENDKLRREAGVSPKADVPLGEKMLRNKIAELRDSIRYFGGTNGKTKKQYADKNTSGDLTERVAQLERETAKCGDDLTQSTAQLNILLERIYQHNQLQRQWQSTAPGSKDLIIAGRQIMKVLGDDFYKAYINDPIDTSLE